MFWDNFVDACIANGTKPTPLLQELNISTGSIGRWKKGGAVTSDILTAISNRLNVSTDYLLTGKEHDSGDAYKGISNEERRLLSMYNSLSEIQRAKCYAYIQGMYDSSDKKEKSAV